MFQRFLLPKLLGLLDVEMALALQLFLLPKDILGHIFSFVDVHDLKSIRQACKAWKNATLSLEDFVLRIQ